MSDDKTAIDHERRKSVLSDQDFERIADLYRRETQAMFEVIGYDTSTPESRTEIRKDHEFVRSTRKGKNWLVGSLITSGMGWAAYFLAKATGKAP